MNYQQFLMAVLFFTAISLFIFYRMYREYNDLKKKSILTKQNKIQYLIITIVIFGLFSYFSYNIFHSEKLLSTNITYVKIKIINIKYSYKRSYDFYCFYSYNNISHKDYTFVSNDIEDQSYGNLKKYIGRYFYGKVSIQDPSYFDILINNEIKDTTIVQPIRGWKSIPTN